MNRLTKKIFQVVALITVMGATTNILHAQEEDTVQNVIDDIQIDIKSATVDAKTKTATIELYLISYQRNPREFKLNTFATQVVDAKGQMYMYTTMQMGKVLVKLVDRQNYLNYFMEDGVPVPLKITVDNWPKTVKPSKLKLVFEDSTEQGKFIEKAVNL